MQDPGTRDGLGFQMHPKFINHVIATRTEVIDR